MKRRLLSAFLAVMMVLTMAPVAFAADEDAENTAGDTGSSEVVSAVAKIGDTDYATLQAAVDAAKADDTITLLKDITVDGTDKATSRTVIDKPITLDLNDKTIKSPDNMGNNNKNFAALYISADVTINATTGGINTGTNGAYAINVMNGATLTINGGNYYGGGTAVQVEKGTANINGGTFACEPYSKPTYGYKFLINCIDAAYKNGTAKVSIKGGSFVNYDPSDSASENPIGNFCASGYVAVKGGTENAPVWTVEDHRVAEVGNTGYSTLSAAVAAANNGDTVTLLTNTDEDITIAQDKDIILDLNGKKLTNVASHTIFNKGTLTINGNKGTVDNVTHGTAAVYNDVTGKVTINGGSYTRSAEASKDENNSGGNSWYVIHNYGIMNINKGTFKFSDTNVGAFSSLIHNGWYDGSKNTAQKNAVMTINDGDFTQGTGGKITVKNDDYGELEIKGGVFTQPQNNYYCIFSYNIAKISGGTINGYVGNAYGNETCDKGDLTISDNAVVNGDVQSATAAGNDSSDKKNLIKITDNAKVAGAITSADVKYVSVSGGYFTTDPSKYLATYTDAEKKYIAKAVTGDYKFHVELADKNDLQVVPVAGATSAPSKEELAKNNNIPSDKVDNIVTAAKAVSAPEISKAAQEVAANISDNSNTLGKQYQDAAKNEVPNQEKIEVRTYLDVEPKAYNGSAYTLDITPKYDVVVVGTKNGTTAKKVVETNTLNVTKATVVTMELPAGFAVADGAKLSIKHTKSNGTVEYYTGTVTEQSGKHLLTFTTNGFSPFVISVPAASIGENVYPTLQAAADAAKSTDVISVKSGASHELNFTTTKSVKVKNDTGAAITVKFNGTNKDVAKDATETFSYTKPSSGSSGGSSSGKTTYKVTTSAVNNGGVNASPSSAEKGAAITITLSPDKGYKLDKLTVTDGSGKTVSTVKKSDTVYTFTMPASAVKVGVSYVKATETPSGTKFNDVSANDWFASAVDYVTGKGMMNGTADNTFSPKANTTRGMVVTVLYRLENQPSTSAASFTDVASGAYYANAVAWANANGIVSGYGSGKFGPNDKVTREQLAAILYRYAQYKKYDVSVGEDTNILSYDDAQSISSYAIPAIQWACGAGVVTGKSGSKLDPKGNATRAEVAAMLMRFCENVK